MTDEDRLASPRVFLFSGMGADDSIFVAQKRAFPNLTVVPWITPLSDESLAEYSTRIGKNLEMDQNCVVGGASFGGIVAQEVARNLKSAGCFLIGSVRTPKELPLRIRIWRPIRGMIPFLPMRVIQQVTRIVIPLCRSAGWRHVASVLKQFSSADSVTLKWSMEQILCWKGTEFDGPIFQIHGRHDHILPVRRITADEVIPNGGHVISLTHGSIVNDFLRQHIEELLESTSTTSMKSTQT